MATYIWNYCKQSKKEDLIALYETNDTLYSEWIGTHISI